MNDDNIYFSFIWRLIKIYLKKNNIDISLNISINRNCID